MEHLNIGGSPTALRECPFCGKKVNAYVNPRFPNTSPYFIASIVCDNCKIEVSKSSPYCSNNGLEFNDVINLMMEVANKWNTRVKET